MKREINVGDVVGINGGTVPHKVEDIREVDGVNKYYITAEGLSGVHAVTETEITDHATAEEYAGFKAAEAADEDSEDEDSEDEGNDTDSVVTTSASITDPTLSTSPTDLGNDTTPAPTSDAAPVVPTAPVKTEQKHNHKHNGNKRRV